jgi:hypothetical protein
MDLQERERKERERAVRAKVAACAFARGYLGGIVKTVFQQLQDTGYFYDPVEREVGCLWQSYTTLTPYICTSLTLLLAPFCMTCVHGASISRECSSMQCGSGTA